MDFKRLWADARLVRDHIEGWLVFNALLDSHVHIAEFEEIHPQPRGFTFVAARGLLQHTKAVPAQVLDDNKHEIELFAQTIADYLYCELVKKHF